MAEKIDIIDIIVANPAGNTTVLVLTPVPVERYQEIAHALLAIDFKADYSEAFADGEAFGEDIYRKEIKAEQVGFCLQETVGGLPAMNMSGLEFCGNAARAFAWLKANEADPHLKKISVMISGCDRPLMAEIDTESKTSKIQMPLPKIGWVYDKGILIYMDGISHLVVKDMEPTLETFNGIKAKFYPEDPSGRTDQDVPTAATQSNMDFVGNFPAFGVMFLDTKTRTMTPVVYVHDINTTYFEGSCASGTTAASFAAAMDLPDGIHKMTFRQPAGTLYSEVTKVSGEITEIKLSGRIEFSDVITVDLRQKPGAADRSAQ